MLNVYKVPAKEHQVVDSWAADKMSFSEILFWKYVEYVPLILHNSKKLRRKEFVRFGVFFNFKCAIKLSANCTIIWRRTIMYLLKITILLKFLRRVKNMFP